MTAVLLKPGVPSTQPWTSSVRRSGGGRCPGLRAGELRHADSNRSTRCAAVGRCSVLGHFVVGVRCARGLRRRGGTQSIA